jgi:hypothetical protein
MSHIPIDNNDTPKNIENITDLGIKTDDKLNIE